MREFWVADSETDPFDGETIVKPFVWDAYNGIEHHLFETTAAFVEFFREKDVVVYAHNGGKFDWFFILAYIDAYEPLTVINGRLAKFKIGTCEFRDSYNILPSALSAYKKDEIDYAIFTKAERHKRANWEKITDYLRHDCIYLYEFVKRFIDDYGYHLTFAGCALAQWQKISQIKAPSTGPAFFHDIGRYYYGGRVECFETGILEFPLKSIDIKSAYPWAGNHLHPWGEAYTETKVLPTRQEELSRCFITLTTTSKGALPFRDIKGGLSFPADGLTREFFITGWEFIAARDTGALPWFTISRIVVFPLTIEFNSYNDHFFAEKERCEKAGDKAGREIAKYMLNGLTGKFGANPNNYEEFQLVEPQHIDAARRIDGYTFSAQIGEYALVKRPLPESKHRYYNVATIASITGFVRAHLWRSMCKCERVVYVDTDNIKCASTGSLEVGSKSIGSWQLEAESTRSAFAGKKLYSMVLADGTHKSASKGVRLTPQEIFKIALGAEIQHNPQAPSFSLKNGTKFVSRKIKRTK